MTDLNAKIIPLQTEVEGREPTDAQCDVGEIAINLTDRKIFSKRSDGTIVTLAGGSKIQDAEDFDLNSYTPPMQRWDNQVSMNCNSTPTITGAGQFLGPGTCWSNWFFYLGATDSDDNAFDENAWPSSLEAGDTVYLLTDKESDWISYTLADKPTWSSSRGWRMPPDSNGVSLTGGFTWIQASPAPGAAYVDIPLAYGDAIVWSADPIFGDAFRPRQFKIEQLLDVDVPVTTITAVGFRWQWGADDNQYQPAGEFGGRSGQSSIQFSVLDADGIDRTDFVNSMTVGARLWMKVSDGDWASYSCTAAPTNFGNGSFSQATIGITANGTWQVMNGQPAGTNVWFHVGEYAPTSETTGERNERDVLQWDATDEIYKHQALLFDITAAQDFAFQQAVPATPRWTEGDWLEDGEFTRTTTQWIFNLTDANANDQQGFFERWAAATSIWHSADGTTWSEEPFNQLEVKTQTGTCEITFDDPAPAASAALYIAFSEPGIEIDQPLVDGQVMVWNGTHWTPENVTEGLALALNDLSDVNTITNPPTAGQALVWDDLNGYWRPGTVATDGGGAETLGELTDVTLGTPATGEVLTYSGADWVNAKVNWSNVEDTPAVPQVIDDLDDVDTSTVPPTPGQVLTWDGSNWAPATATGGGGARETVGGALTERADVTVTTDYTATGTEAIEFTGLGEAGSFVQVTATQPCWVRFYGTELARTSDALRPVDQDPLPGSGVLLEVRIPVADEVVTVSPGALYYNNDTLPEQTLYALVTNDSGQAAAIGVTVRAYTQTHTQAIVGGTFGSG